MQTLIVRSTVFLCVVLMSVNSFSSSVGVSDSFDDDIVTAVAGLHGLSEEQAVDRLAKEYEAAIAYKHIRGLFLRGYAGSWFDENSMRLKVAVSDPADLSELELFDVETVVVKHSLADLKSKLDQATNMLRGSSIRDSAIVISYVDIKSNRAVLGIEKSLKTSVQEQLDGAKDLGMIEVIEKTVSPVLSTGSFRGSDEYRNEYFETRYSVEWPCSIGAPIEDGFVTIGHCAFEGHNLLDENGDDFGEVQDSEWEDTTNGPDVAYVETFTGWTPLAEVNGYTDGNIDISEKWGGLVDYAVGSTLCRYGRTSGGPLCEVLDYKDVDVTYPSRIIAGLSVVGGSCTIDGDSGGTWVAGTGQIQGIHVGGQPFNNGDECPTTFVEVYFQPIRDALDEYNVTMLTQHGSNAPDITAAECPDLGVSTYGRFFCEVTNVDSQGEVSLQWTSSNGGSSTKTWLVKTCIPPSTISVTLQATNPYGTDTKYYSFPCPSSN